MHFCSCDKISSISTQRRKLLIIRGVVYIKKFSLIKKLKLILRKEAGQNTVWSRVRCIPLLLPDITNWFGFHQFQSLRFLCFFVSAESAFFVSFSIYFLILNEINIKTKKTDFRLLSIAIELIICISMKRIIVSISKKETFFESHGC